MYRQPFKKNLLINNNKTVSIEKSIFIFIIIYVLYLADVAQLVEQRIRNAWVPGSSPGIGSNSAGKPPHYLRSRN